MAIKPVLNIGADLNRKKSQEQIQKSLDSISKNLKITIGVDKTGSTELKKQVSDVDKVLKSKLNIEQQTLKQAKAEKLVADQIDKQRQKLALFQEEMARKSTKLTSGKFGSTVDTSVLSSLQSRTSSLSIGSASDIKGVQAEMGKINSEFKNLALNAQQARTGFTRLGDEAKHNFQKISEYAIIGGIFMGMANQIKVAIKASYDLDNAINQVRIVTGQTEEQAQSLVGTFKELGKMANVSLTDTANLYADLTRQGLEGSALEDRFIAISKYSKISGLDVQKSMDIITSAVNGTKRPVEEIIDVMAVLGDKSSADAAEIGEALQRTASVASVAGIDFKKLSSYIATVSETTRTAASVVGASMRSMIVRFNQLREQGFNEEDTTQINDVVQALSTIGIDAFDDSTQSLMNFSDILEQLAPKWDTLDDKTRNYLQTSLAGNYQADKFAALMSNYTRAQELYGYALDSSGQATAKFEIYQESAQAKVERFQLALENLYTTLASSTIIKDAIDTGTDFVNMLNMASNDITALIPLVLSLASAMTVLKASALVKEGGLLAGLGLSAGALGGIALAVGAVAVAILSVKSAMEEAKVATENYKKAQEDLNYVLGVGGEKSKQRAEDLEELVRQYEQLTMELTVARKKLAEDESDDTSGRLTKNISNIQKQIAELGKKFKELGVTTSEAKSKIDELNQATEKSQKINESLSKLDIAEKQKKELDTVSNLASTYNELLEKKKRSKEEDEKLSSVSAVLASKLKDLGISYELNSEGIITNVSGVKTLISEKQKLTEVSVQSAVKEMTIEKERLNVMLSSIKTELEARKAYADAMAGMSFDFAKASSMENKKQNIMSDPLGLSRDTSLDKTTQFLQGQAEQYTNTSKAISDAIDSIATKTAGVPDLLSGVGDDKTSKSKKETIALLTALEKQLEANNYQLELQRKLTSQLAEDDPKRIDSLEQEIALMAQRQKLVSAQADVLRKEKASIEAKIKSNKATMEEKKRLEEINTEIYSLKLSWQDLNGQMKTAGQTIKDFGKESKEAIAKANIEAVDELKEAIKSLIEQEYEDKINAEKDSLEIAKEQLDIRLKQIDAEKDLADFMADRNEKEKDITSINNKMLSLQTAAKQGDMKAISELSKLEEERAKKQLDLDNLINDETFENKKEALQNEYDLYEDASNDRIDKLEKELKEAGSIAKRVNAELASYVNGTNNQLYESLINWNSKYGTGMDSDIIGKWNTAIQLLQTYKSQLGGISGVSVGDYNTAQTIGTGAYKRESVIAQMKANSAKWSTASASERTKLNNENRMLATSIGATFNSKEGRYYDSNGVKLYDNGGLKPVGTVGVMAENVKEWVLKDNNIIDLAKIGVQQYISQLSSNNLPTFTSNQNMGAPIVNITVSGSVSDQNVNRIINSTTATIQDTLDTWRSRGLKPATRTR